MGVTYTNTNKLVEEIEEGDCLEIGTLLFVVRDVIDDESGLTILFVLDCIATTEGLGRQPQEPVTIIMYRGMKLVTTK